MLVLSQRAQIKSIKHEILSKHTQNRCKFVIVTAMEGVAD